MGPPVKRGKAMVEARQDRRQGQQPGTSGRQLDRQRQAIKTPAQLTGQFHGHLIRAERWERGLSPAHEELDRLGSLLFISMAPRALGPQGAGERTRVHPTDGATLEWSPAHAAMAPR